MIVQDLYWEVLLQTTRGDSLRKIYLTFIRKKTLTFIKETKKNISQTVHF